MGRWLLLLMMLREGLPDYKTTVGNVELVSLADGHGDSDPVETFPDGKLVVFCIDG